MNNIEKTKKLIADGKVAICNPVYLSCCTEEQQEKSLLGQRTAFIAFHRFLFALSDMHIYRAWDGYKSAYAQAKIDFPDEICCDLSLLCDALQYQIAVRDDKQGVPDIAEQIAISFRANSKLAQNYDEITSDYLIGLCKEWIERLPLPLPHRIQPGEKIALKEEGEKLNGMIQLRCRLEQKGRFIAEAKKRGQKLSEFILQAAEEKLREKNP